MTKNRESNLGENLTFFGIFNQAKCHTACVDLCYTEQFGSYSMAVEELKVLSLQFIVSKVKHKITIHVSRKNKAKSYNEQFLLCLRT